METTRPRILDQFIRTRLAKKKTTEGFEAEEKRLLPAVLDVLRKSTTFAGIQLIQGTKITVKSEEAIVWAKEHLSDKQFEGLFVKILDQDRFVKLIARLKRKQPEMMADLFPDDIIKIVPTEVVRVTAKEV